MRSTNNRKLTRLRLENLEARRLMSVYADFNGDGFDDLAIGVPGEDAGAGMVQVLYGSASGLSATGSQSMTQTILGTDSSEAGDNFGAALAGADFNNDGFTDLAIGVPGEDVGTIVDAGAVHYVFGSASGLTGSGDYIMHEDTNRVREFAETGDFFGQSLAAGDWNNDGFVDIAVGVPGQDVNGKVDAGGIHVFYGTPSGIKPPTNQIFNLDSFQMSGDAGEGDAFGSALAAGDFNGDGRDDLAIGVPRAANLSNVEDFGRVSVMYSGTNGLSASGSLFFAEPNAQAGNKWGSAVAAGDFNGDGRDDLAASSPFGTDFGSIPECGTVTIMFGSATGVSLTGFQKFDQSDFVSGAAETGDHWGFALAAADSNSDGFDDLAVGAPDEDVGAIVDAGHVDIIRGSATGITTTNFADKDQDEIGAVSETGDRFGATVAWGDFNGNGSADVVYGTPDEDVGAAANAGTVYVQYTLVGPGPQTWNQDTAGIFDTAEAGDRFGGGLDTGAGRDYSGAHLVTALNELAEFSLSPWVRGKRRR